MHITEEEWSSSNQLAPQDVESLLSILECGICVDFLKGATETSCCHKLFCDECIQGWLATKQNCPICRSPLSTAPHHLHHNVVIQRFIDQMSVECPHPQCSLRPARSDLASHVAACPHRPELQKQRQREQTARLEQRVKSVTVNVTVNELLSLSRDLLTAGDQTTALSMAQRALEKCNNGNGGGGNDRECREVLGDALFAAGQYQKSLESFREAQCSGKMADCQIKLAQYDAAEVSLKAAMAAEKDASSLASARLMGKLGELKKKTSSYSEALQYLSSAMRLVDRNSAEWCELTMSNADVLRKIERYDESRQQYVHVLKKAEVLLGKKSPQVAACLNALGILTKKLGQYEDATKYYKSAIKLKVFLNGGSHNHAQIAEFLTNLGDVFRKKSDYAQADALYRRSLQIFEATVGPDHIECAETWNSLGLVAKKFARYDEAAECYDRALRIARATFRDKPHYKLGIYGHNRADVERKRGNYQRALDMYVESLSMLRQTLGPQHSECAEPLHGMGLVQHQMGRYDQALDSIQSALKIVEREFGVSHYKVGVFLSSSGLARAMLQQHDAAHADLKRALHILIQSLGESHVEVADVLAALGDVCMKLYVEGNAADATRLEEGKKYYARARQICVERLGPAHTKVQQMDSLLFIADNYGALM